MVIDKNLLSKKSGQDGANELFGPCKSRLIKARAGFENFVSNHQQELIEKLDELVHTLLQKNNTHGKVSDVLTFDVKFDNNTLYDAANSKAIDYTHSFTDSGLKYTFYVLYHQEVDKDLVDMNATFHKGNVKAEFLNNCKKYLNNPFKIRRIDVNAYDNSYDVVIDINEYLVKIANEYSHFVVAYLAKQGIKSRAVQSGKEVKVVIERDTDTGGFENI